MESESILIDISVPLTDNPIKLKDRMLYLQSKYELLVENYMIAKLSNDSLEAALSYIKDKCVFLLPDDKKGGSAQERQSRAKVEVKVKVPFFSEGNRVTEELTYYECKYKLVAANNKMATLWFKLEELKSAIDICKFYPTKGL